MKRAIFFVYGIGCYLLFLAVYAYMAGFVGDFLVPKSIDSPASGGLGTALAVNLLLITAFALQHSIMARPAFKRVWTRVVPTPVERSTYVLASCLLLIGLMWAWRPIPTVVWNVQSGLGRALLTALLVGGWLLVPAVTRMISHFDLFGTRQVWLYLRGREYTALPFRTPMLYGRVRHPLYLGWALFFWATPTMTVGHLLFAGTLTGYMGLAALFEERDLIAVYGRKYEEYRRRVPMFLPRLSRPGVATEFATSEAADT
jgi:protein-S-isoprenylcysteine O-methyltransferase Ste14